MKTRIKSAAFRRAKLKSEQYRTVLLVGLLGILAIYGSFRCFMAGNYTLLIEQLVVFSIAIGYEVFTLIQVRKALANDSDLSQSMWLLSIFVETQIPTIVIISIIESQINTPFQALISPALLLYFFFTILSVLRLSPKLSVITGTLSALGYLGAVLYVESSYSISHEETRIFPLLISFVYVGIIFTSGLLAAFVANQTRNYVVAALREAELESELERVKHDLEVARSIQQGLFPTEAPSLENFEIAGWNLPADETGGDYFDWQEMPDGQLAISLADATGHGIGPALVSTACRAYARASLVSDGHRDEVLAVLNRLLTADLPSNRFVTYVVIFLDPATSKVKVLSAGHGPILWYKYATDEVINLEAQGIPLGMLDGIEYALGTEGSLESGDVLALVTDGFFEWENPEGEEFGIPRLEAVLKAARGLAADEIVDKLRSSVADFSEGTVQKDDLTAVIIRRKTGKHSGEYIH